MYSVRTSHLIVEPRVRYLNQKRLNALSMRVDELLKSSEHLRPSEPAEWSTWRTALVRLLSALTRPLDAPILRRGVEPVEAVSTATGRLLAELAALEEAESCDARWTAEELSSVMLAVARAEAARHHCSLGLEGAASLFTRLQTHLFSLPEGATGSDDVRSEELEHSPRGADNRLEELMRRTLMTRVYGSAALNCEQLARVSRAFTTAGKSGTIARADVVDWMADVSLRVIDEDVCISAESLAAILQGNAALQAAHAARPATDRAHVTALFACGSVLAQKKIAQFRMRTLSVFSRLASCMWSLALAWVHTGLPRLRSITTTGFYIPDPRLGVRLASSLQRGRVPTAMTRRAHMGDLSFVPQGSLVDLLQAFERMGLQDPYLITRVVAHVPRLGESPNCHVLEFLVSNFGPSCAPT